MEERKKYGRPTKAGNERKYIHSVRLTEEENSRLQEKIVQYGGTASQYFRDCILKKEIVAAVDKNTIRILKNYLHIMINSANNLNNITRKINGNKANLNVDDIKQAKLETAVFISDLRKIIGDITRTKQ